MKISSQSDSSGREKEVGGTQKKGKEVFLFFCGDCLGIMGRILGEDGN